MECPPRAELLKSMDVKDVEDSLKKLKVIAENANFVIAETDVFEKLLCADDENLLALSAQSIAELAKSSENRKLLTKCDIIRPLLRLCRYLNADVCLQSFRAIGNICYDNDDAVEIVSPDGVRVLIEKIQNIAENTSLTSNPQIFVIVCGCLLNVLSSSDDLQKVALECKVVSAIEKVLVKISADLQSQESCVSCALQILNFAVDHMVDQWISNGLCTLLIDILKEFEKHEISVLILEILRTELEYDDIKLCLAKQGFCELVYELVEKYKSQADDEESRSVLKMACDLIVLILTEDASMVYLYDDSRGEVFHQMVSWLDSDDLDLLTTAVLAIGNFAREDSHCIYMVNCGISNKLLDILSSCNTSQSDLKLQYALLSVLRHLSIPFENKGKLIEANIIEVLYSLIFVDYPPVVFKLMATFRMLSDRQEKIALDLITRKEFMERIVYWYDNLNHLGVHSEAPRLLARLIKNCHSTKFIPTCITMPDSIKCLVEMLSSSYLVMQKEALVALNVIYSYSMNVQNNRTNEDSITYIKNETENNIKLDNESKNIRHSYVNAVIKAEIGKMLTVTMKKYYDKMDKELLNNVLQLLDELVKSEEIVEHLKNCNLSETLLLLCKNENASDLDERINSLVAVCK